MKWIANPESLRPRRFEIEHDECVGFYFYVFEGGKDICDYLQDSLEMAIEFAFEDFRVPKEAWRKVEE